MKKRLLNITKELRDADPQFCEAIETAERMVLRLDKIITLGEDHLAGGLYGDHRAIIRKMVAIARGTEQ